MRFECVLKVACNPDEARALFVPELEARGRAKSSLKTGKDWVRFCIEADDAAALRASFNSVAKLLYVWEAAQYGTRKKNPGKAKKASGV
jgi:tRNA threonylcarbamoyladenosine modification (KEOPS) complex  Pcc1 subunit